MEPSELAALDYCYLTTTGRRTGHPHTIEIWFGLQGEHVYLLAGGGDGADWVRNLQANPTVALRLGDRDLITRARIVDDPGEDSAARKLLLGKYQSRSSDDLAEWARTAQPVSIDFPAPEAAEDRSG
jgi:deazaflavin-dependent oxidoreductase (nitroreductase family)